MNAQHADIRQGSGNTVIQIVGDGNRVEAGHPHLSLTRFAARRQIRQDFDRLSPYTRSVPLIGRETQMDSLRAFLDQPASVRVRVVTGPGGCGKTRLALELCEQRVTQGWDAGFATGREMKRFLAQQNLAEWGWRRPTLIVVDYAAQHAEVLGNWIAELADRDAAGDAPPLRLLLLERQANPESGWWHEVFESGGYGAASKRALLDPAQPWTVPPVPDAESRLAVLEALLRGADPAEALRLDAADLLPRLAAVEWGGDPLSLLMAALTMQLQGHTLALVARRTDLAQQLARREGDRIGELAAGAGLDKVLALHLAAAATLAQGMPRAIFESFADGERTALRRTDGGDAASLAEVLTEALPRADGGIAAVVPDLIGEAFALEFLGGADASAAVLRCAAATGETILAESLVRMAQDYGGLSEKPLQWLDTLVDSANNDALRLRALSYCLPDESVALRHTSLCIAQRRMALEVAEPTTPPEQRARLLETLSLALSRNGRRGPALEAAHEAVALRRELVAARPDLTVPDLAMSLSNQANRLRDIGRREPALEAAQEAVTLYRHLAVARPDLTVPDLAMSLSNLANMLRDLGRREPALELAQEAVELLRPLAAARPDVFVPNLATSLNNLANMLRDMGLREPALEAAQEAVILYRQVAAARPDSTIPNLAMSLSNLANMLGDLGRREPALQAAQEAVALRRELAASRPDVFVPDLATSLNNLANALSDLGRREGALESAQEAVALRRELAASRPDVFIPDLAMSLNNVAIMLSELGRGEPALEAAQEAVTLYRQLATARPDSTIPDLAMSLSNLANMLGDLGRREPALEAAQEAVELLRRLATARPDVFTPNLATSLNNLANRLSDLGRREPALESAHEAVKLLRRLAAAQPDAFVPNLATSLSNLAIWLSELGRGEPALEAAQEAVALRRQLAAARPDVFVPDLARSLIVLALRVEESAQTAEAVASAVAFARESLATLAPAFLVRPEVHRTLTQPVLREYLRLCERASLDPDEELLAPLIRFFPSNEGESE